MKAMKGCASALCVAAGIGWVAWAGAGPAYGQGKGGGATSTDGAGQSTAPEPQAPTAAEKSSVLDFSVKDIDGKDVPLSKFKGDVLLIVNVATQCGLTEANYTRLEPLYQKYKAQGFRILAFPCNDFGGQEPGTHEEIKSFCRTTHHGTYELFSKVAVKGDKVEPLYKYLTEHPDKEIAGPVQWNFQKYVVGRDGKVIAKYSPRTNPDDEKLTAAIETALKAERPKETAKGEGK